MPFVTNVQAFIGKQTTSYSPDGRMGGCCPLQDNFFLRHSRILFMFILTTETQKVVPVRYVGLIALIGHCKKCYYDSDIINQHYIYVNPYIMTTPPPQLQDELHILIYGHSIGNLFILNVLK